MEFILIPNIQNLDVPWPLDLFSINSSFISMKTKSLKDYDPDSLSNINLHHRCPSLFCCSHPNFYDSSTVSGSFQAPGLPSFWNWFSITLHLDKSHYFFRLQNFRIVFPGHPGWEDPPWTSFFPSQHLLITMSHICWRTCITLSFLARL